MSLLTKTKTGYPKKFSAFEDNHGFGTLTITPDSSGWIAIILAVMMFLAPALGVPSEELLQDTFKSMLVSFMTLAAAALFFWQQRARQQPILWHPVMWFPLALMLYALGSMVWSHTYLAGVEAVRWFIFAVLLWLGINTFSRERIPLLAWGIHGGAVVASAWAAFQFWGNFDFFPQSVHPASTFSNRNFFAEFAVCALPFSAYLLAQARSSKTICSLAFTSALTIVAVLMTGTRSALAALWLLLFLLLPLIGFLYRKHFEFSRWRVKQRFMAAGLLLITLVSLGLIDSTNPLIAREMRGTNALERGLYRSASVITDDDEFITGSLSIRLVMWKATGRMIANRPLSGVGAGAWEVQMPLYQNAGSQLETDYYAHNELLQLLAEYGLVGWIALTGLLAYLTQTAWRTFRDRGQPDGPGGGQDNALRALTLTSLFAFMVVSNAGFAWRLAATGAIFAIGLGILGACDARLPPRRSGWRTHLAWKPLFSKLALASSLASLALAGYIAQQAASSEIKLVSAFKLALTIVESRQPLHPQWRDTKKEVLRLVGEGIAINPHYRKITPLVGDYLARWGDWKNATWIWESVVRSRPYVVVLLTNTARGYAQTGNMAKALEYLRQAQQIQPQAVAVRSLEVVLLSRTDREEKAASLARQYLQEKTYDYDMTNAAWLLGMRQGDYALAILGLELRNQGWPVNQLDGFLKLGNIYAFHQVDKAMALGYYQAAWLLVTDETREYVRAQIPPVYLAQL